MKLLAARGNAVVMDDVLTFEKKVVLNVLHIRREKIKLMALRTSLFFVSFYWQNCKSSDNSRLN